MNMTLNSFTFLFLDFTNKMSLVGIILRTIVIKNAVFSAKFFLIKKNN